MLSRLLACGCLVARHPAGQFAGISCYLIIGPNGSITISRGDGEAVRIGKWQAEGADILAKSQVVYRTVTTEGRSMPETEISERFSGPTPDQLSSSQSEDRYLKELSNIDYFGTLIRCDRSGWHGQAEGKDFVPPCMASE